MKRITAVICAVMMMVMMAVPAVFADETLTTTSAPASGLQIVSTIPADGKTGLQTTNIAVKVKFNQDMTDESNDEINNTKITLVPVNEEEELEYSFRVVHSKSAPNELWYILETGTLSSNSEYVVKLESGIVATSGDVLSTPYELTFKTRNTSTDSMISMVLMFAMMGVMFYMTSKAAKKEAAKTDSRVAEKQRVEALNPYKIAKEKNISVDEAKAYVKKEKEKYQKEVDKYEAEQKKKADARAAEVAAAQERIEAELEAQRTAYFYKVKGPKSITLTGREVPKAVTKQKKKSAERKAAKLKAEQAARDARSKGKKSKK